MCFLIIIIIIIIIIIGSTALVSPWPPQANVASDLYPTNQFLQPSFLVSSSNRQSILISVGHVLVDFHGLSTVSF
jgi:hypothetical protein